MYEKIFPTENCVVKIVQNSHNPVSKTVKANVIFTNKLCGYYGNDK